MCLAIPMTITEINGIMAIAESNGIKTKVNVSMTPDITINDKVLVHAGFTIEKLDEKQAAEIEETWKEYFKALDNS
jgi:hydrogenase expression/formation protein HypC